MFKNNFLNSVNKNKSCGGTKKQRDEIKNNNVVNFLKKIQTFIEHCETENVYILTVLDRLDDSPERRLARSWFNRGLLSKEGKYAFTTRSGKWVPLRVVDIRSLTNVSHSRLNNMVHPRKSGQRPDIHYKKGTMEAALRQVAMKMKKVEELKQAAEKHSLSGKLMRKKITPYFLKTR